MSATTQAAIDLLAERQRQVTAEGWTSEHDDKHGDQSLALAAAWYATPEFTRDALDVNDMSLWPGSWLDEYFKPGNRRRELVKAGALILAEIERLDRAAGVPAPMQISTAGVLTGQILVMATLLERAIGVVKNVEAEGCDEGEQLQALIDDSEAAIAAVLTQHAMPTTTLSMSTNQEQSMTTVITTAQPPALLTYWPQEGGTYIGVKSTPDGKAFHVVAAIGEHELVDQEWGEYGKRIEGADSYHDGRANTEAMAAADSPLGKAILALDIGGHTDWALPSQADGHLLAANAKHLMNQDSCYWLSTQYSADGAWCQFFDDGSQDTNGKDCEFRAVPVRCIQIV